MILLVDGGNLVHRCRHAFSLSSNGLDTSVTYGSLRVLSNVMERYTPEVVVFCWDGGVPAYRYRYCQTYKRHTHEDDPSYPDFLRQLAELRSILPAFGVVSAYHRHVEADDLIGQAVRMLDSDKVIMTTDKDLYQCIADDVIVYDPLKEIEITKTNFEEITDGVKHWEWPTYRAMVGDGSDGIPGCKGIGHKNALDILRKCGYSFLSIIDKVMDPKSDLSVGMRTKLKDYGTEGFVATLRVMRLEFDISGARLALLEAIQSWKSFEQDTCRAFLGNNAFVSLMDPNFYKLFRRLEDPAAYLNDLEELRFPRVAPERKYYE